MSAAVMEEMNGTVNGAAARPESMYEEVMAIQDLNKVEGFDPRKYMRIIQEGDSVRYYLDVAFRKLWFRLKYPEGKIVKKMLKLTEQVAIVEARVYLNRNDPEDSFISNALAQKYFSTEDSFGNKFVELAETAAVGRALTDAGFGLQFADRDGEVDPQVTEAPFDAGLLFPNGSLPEGTYMEESAEEIPNAGGNAMEDSISVAQTMQTITAGQTGNVQQETAQELPGQYDMETYLASQSSTGNAMTPAMQQSRQGENTQNVPAQSGQHSRAMQGGKTQNVQNQTAGSRTQPAGNHAAPVPGKTMQEIDRSLPVETLYGMLSRDKAATVVISAGYHKGKTLGQLSVEKPGALDWYVTSYGGPDNLLRAAAKYLIDSALKQAS